MVKFLEWLEEKQHCKDPSLVLEAGHSDLNADQVLSSYILGLWGFPMALSPRHSSGLQEYCTPGARQLVK